MGNKCSEKLQINLHDVNGWKREKNNREQERERAREKERDLYLWPWFLSHTND